MGNQRARNILVYTLIIVAAVVIVFGVRGSDRSAGDISPWTLIDDINEGRVDELTVDRDGDLKATYDDGQKYTIDTNIREEQVYMWLEWYGADYEMIPYVETKSSTNLIGVIGTLLPILLIGGFIWLMLRASRKQTTTVTEMNKNPAELIQPALRFSDLGGVDDAAAQLRGLIDVLRAPQRLTEVGASMPHGVLLTGDPGTGKTLLAQAAGGEAGSLFYHVSGAQFAEIFTGVASGRIKNMFAEAKKQSQPTIIFIDELDSIASKRSMVNENENDERQQALNQLCAELDQLAPDAPILVIGATNRPDLLDPALLRSGRLDRRIHLARPDAADREQILRLHAQRCSLEATVDLTRIAQMTEYFTGADLARLVNEAAMLAAQQQRTILNQRDFEQAVERIRVAVPAA